MKFLHPAGCWTVFDTSLVREILILYLQSQIQLVDRLSIRIEQPFLLPKLGRILCEPGAGDEPALRRLSLGVGQQPSHLLLAHRPWCVI